MANDRVYQVPVEVVVEPTDGEARVSQLPVEAVVAPTSAQARVSQLPVEAVIAPTSAKARAYQVVVEVLVQVVPTNARLTQLPVEVAVDPTSQNARLTQLPVEVAVDPTSQNARLTQLPVEAALSPTSQRARLTQLVAEVAIRVVPGGAFTADASIRRSQTGSFTANAVLKRTSAATFTVNAALKVTRTGSFTADAVVPQAGFSTFTANAVIRRTQAASFTADASSVRTVAGTFTANAILKRTQTPTFTANAALKTTRSGSFTSNAVVRRTFAGSFTANATMNGAGSFTANAVIYRSPTGSFTANAYVFAAGSGAFIVSASIKRTQTGSFTVNATKRRVLTGTFTANATKLKTLTGSRTINAVIAARRFTADAVKLRTQTGSRTANAVIKRTGQTGSYTVDALKIQGFFRAYAVIKVPARTGSYTANAWIKIVQTASFTVNALRMRPVTGTLTANATILAPVIDPFTNTFTIDYVTFVPGGGGGGGGTGGGGTGGGPGGGGGGGGGNSIPTHTVPTRIFVNGVEIAIGHVIWKTAKFTAKVNSQTGECEFDVVDRDHNMTFETGDEIKLYIDGRLFWGGWVLQVSRKFAFPVVGAPLTDARIFHINGGDYNRFLDRRILHDSSQPDRTWNYPAGTYDNNIFNDMWPYFDTAGFTKNIRRVGYGVLDIKGVTGKTGGLVAQGGFSMRDVLMHLSWDTGAIYYVTPEKVVTYVDADLISSPYTLTDVPSGAMDVAYRAMRVTEDSTEMVNDSIVWGAGKGSGLVVVSRYESAASQIDHGRWQAGNFTSGIYKQATANAVAQARVEGSPASKRGAKNPKRAVQIETWYPVFSVGDVVHFHNSQFFLPPADPNDAPTHDDILPIRTMTITWPTPDNPLFDLQLSWEVDAVWSFFDPWLPTGIPGIGGVGPVIPGGTEDPPGGCGDDCGITDTYNYEVAQVIANSSNEFVDIPNHFASSGLTYIFSYVSSDGPAVCSFEVSGSPGVLGAARFRSEPTPPDGYTEAFHYLPFPNYDNTAAIMTLSFKVVEQSLADLGGTSALQFVLTGSGSAFVMVEYLTGDDGGGGKLDIRARNIAFPFNDLILDEIPMTLTTGIWYSVLMDVDTGNYLRVKVWPESDPEPSAWTLEGDLSDRPIFDIDGYNTAFFGPQYPTSLTDAFEVLVDNLNVVGVNACSLTQFDDFSRTVAANGWGNNLTGGAYTSLAGAGPYSVNGSAGVIGALNNGVSRVIGWNVGGAITDTPWYTAGAPRDFTMTAGFIVPSIPTSGYLEIKVEPGNIGLIIRVTTTSTGGVYSHDGLTKYLTKTNWSAGSEYFIEVSYAAGSMSTSLRGLGVVDGPYVEAATPDGTMMAITGFNSGSGTPRTVQFPNIDFNFDGRACYDATCDENMTLIDDFARVSGPRSWGTSTSTAVWGHNGDLGATPQASFSVDGVGHLLVPHPDGLDEEADDTVMFLDNLGPGSNDFSMTFRCRFLVQDTSNDDVTPYISFQYGSVSVSIETGAIHSLSTGRKLEVFGFGDSGSSDLQPFALTTGSWYLFRVENKFATSIKVKIWPEVNAEPLSWTVVRSMTGQTSSANGFSVYLEQGGSSATNLGQNFEIEFDDLYIGELVDCSPQPGEGGGAVPVGTALTEELTPLDTPSGGSYPTFSHWQATNSILAGTAMVSVNTNLQSGSLWSLYDADAGIVEMNLALTESASVTLDYITNGGLA